MRVIKAAPAAEQHAERGDKSSTRVRAPPLRHTEHGCPRAAKNSWQAAEGRAEQDDIPCRPPPPTGGPGRWDACRARLAAGDRQPPDVRACAGQPVLRCTLRPPIRFSTCTPSCMGGGVPASAGSPPAGGKRRQSFHSRCAQPQAQALHDDAMGACSLPAPPHALPAARRRVCPRRALTGRGGAGQGAGKGGRHAVQLGAGKSFEPGAPTQPKTKHKAPTSNAQGTLAPPLRPERGRLPSVASAGMRRIDRYKSDPPCLGTPAPPGRLDRGTRMRQQGILFFPVGGASSQ